MFVKPEESLFVPDLCLVLFIHITNYGILIILVCSIKTTLQHVIWQAIFYPPTGGPSLQGATNI